MSTENIDLRKQLQQHVQSLRGAGVEWAPLRPPLESAQPSRTAAQPVATTPAEVISPVSLLAAADAGTVLTLEERRQALKVLAEKVSKCTQCAALASTRTQTVFAQGPAGAELCFVGEAPGADEDAQGFPFVGAAGQLLTKIIVGCGLKREDVYICNILKCRPPGNRAPLPNEAANCRGFLERQLELVQPKFIVALGASAASNLLNTTQPLGKLRGRFHDYKGIPVMVTYHPAYLLPHRAPEKKRDVWEDMKMLLTKMGKPIPQKQA
ncbi:MAG: uracil-DNA glycosylase [Gemmataceae bacterium]|nr:uracil-DNA glycosylase [Gemmataceae bacterium]MCI0742067.1 uracil-DNA glycosylase [Gemmataceae bacterium]